MKHLEKIKAVPSNLSLGGSPESDQDSDLESELKLELLGKKSKIGSRTFFPDHLRKVRSGILGKILLNSFLTVPRYSSDSSREWLPH